jgi:hypothetical protein
MAARSRFSTSTIIDSEYLVPWLSAEGPLAYSPTKPPARDYFFQYTWILPGIFNPLVNLREHRYFGSPLKDSARILFDFWANARRGDGPALRRYCQFGFFSDNELRTPMAAYHHVRHYRDTPVPCSFNMVVISGSPWRISRASQPERSRFIAASDRPLVSVACDSGLKNSRPLTGKYGESTCASRQTCCRTPSCLSTRFMTASSAARPPACATGLGWATSWPRRPD